MKKDRAILSNNEEGFVIVFVLMILVVVSIIGISASDTAVTEQKVVRNERLYKDLFFDADGGPYMVAKYVSRTIDEKAVQDAVNDFKFVLYDDDESGTTVNDNDIFRNLMGFDPNSYTDAPWELNRDDTYVNLSRGETNHAAGTATEFSSGAEGIGTGSKGGVEIIYYLTSTGEDDDERSVGIMGTYRKLPDIVGGL
jgi:hypothetical protein